MRAPILLLLLIILINFSCSIENSNYLKTLCANNTSSNFIIDTPKGFYYFRTMINEDFLTLKRINKSSDTFRLRIQYYRNSETRIFDFSWFKKNLNFRIVHVPIDTITHEILFDKQKENLRNNWKDFDVNKFGREFLREMQQNNILDLPDCQNIKNYPLEVSYNSVIVQYSCKCKYRMMYYNNASKESERFKEAKLLINFLNYLKKEFNYW